MLAMQSSDDYLGQLKAEERALALRLASVRAAIDVYIKGQISPSETPNLDGLRIRDAINVYLGWAAERGKVTTIADLERELPKFRVMSFKRKPMSDMPFIFKSLCNCIGSPENQKLWHVKRRNKEHFTREDEISLKPPQKS